MAALNERQVKEMDIDWYCLVNGVPTHIASMGGSIPAVFRDREMLRRHQDMVAQIIPFMEVRLNVELVETLTASGYDYLGNPMLCEAINEANRNHPGFGYLNDYELPVRLFASTFVEKARRGFRSYARRENVEGNEYVLIAEPAMANNDVFAGLGLQELECEVRDEGATIVFER